MVQLSFTALTALAGVLAHAVLAAPSSTVPVKRAANCNFPNPSSSSNVVLSTPSRIPAGTTKNGGGLRYGRGVKCGGQKEGGDKDAVFLLESDATLENVVIGADQNEGIHCLGSCTLRNVWFEDVCEDAITIKQTSGTSTIIGGGAKGADDKVIQHNGGGLVKIESYCVQDFGKLYRSCGNCSSQTKRQVEIKDVIARNGKLLAGVNSNFGDVATIDTNSNSYTSLTSVCDTFEGNSSGAEPKTLTKNQSNAKSRGLPPSTYTIMSTQAATSVADTLPDGIGTGTPAFPTKLSHDNSSQLAEPPHVVVRGRSTVDGIEMNVLGSSRAQAPISDEDSIIEPEVNLRKEWAAIAACSMCLFLAGWNDGSIGPLLPTIQRYYGLSFTIVSLLFVSGCLGFMLAGILNGEERVVAQKQVPINEIRASASNRSRRVWSSYVVRYLAGGFCQVTSHAILIPAFSFPVICLAYLINGFGQPRCVLRGELKLININYTRAGVGLQDAQSNGFVGALRNNASAKMGLIHSVYGAGAFISPIIATQFAQRPNCVFGFHTQEELLGPAQPMDPTESGSKDRKYQQIFGSWGIQAMAAFCLMYVGAETTMGGWIVTFFVEERGGGTSAGYISSGFFGGLMLGRVVLLWLNEKVGERRVVYAYVLLAAGLEVTVWMLPNIFGNAIAFALVGVLMGYVFIS
ncbi:hypothetical protein CTheo_7034 [Ceratobasidium theobromae]|uniref:Probable pectate lyase F n=1 Tax=Ceratobasidium theobromae TaxID=1582974 RepID=A0A5N5QDX6_9AGAM|nr:hypothetical protein CTheo_7034 [Ceratobasidium theobromae]